jgi:Leucine-rich repeat (LRR) protein
MMRLTASNFIKQLESNWLDSSDFINLHLEQCSELALEKIVGMIYKKGFAGSVKFLFLTANELLTLPENIVFLYKLRVLGLSYNNFRAFPTQLLQLEALSRLWLDNNRIKELPCKIKNMPKLECIKLENNPIEFLPQLGEITLDIKYTQNT